MYETGDSLDAKRGVSKWRARMMRKVAFVIGFACLSLSSAAVPADDAAGWRTGVASVVITPEGPMWMAGYAARKKPSEGKVHDLHAKALAIEDADSTRLVIVTVDLISVPRPIRDWLEKKVHEKYQLPPDGLMINCSHTHCGPEVRTTPSSLRGLEPERARQAQEYVRSLQEELASLVGQALEALAPAKLSYCHARCGFAMNRRTPTANGFRNFPNPDAPVDHDVPVLRVEGADGKLQAMLFGYACHSTTLGFYQFCGDYGGFAQLYLEESHPGAAALFVAGCGADQNPYPRSELALAEQHGRSLANAVEAALITTPRPLTGKLRSAYNIVTLEYASPPTRDELTERAQSKNKYERAHAENLLIQLEEDGKIRDSYPCPVQVVQFGDALTLVALPGETVVDFSLRLKRELTEPNGASRAIWVAGYSNDVFAYVPSRRVLLEGGYEAESAMKYMTTIVQPGAFAPSVEEKIISKVHELNRRLKED